jgi:hypothetical protein
LNFAVGVGMGLTQQDIDSDDVSGRTSDTLTEYDITTQLFANKPYTIDAFANKSDNLIARDYLGPLRSEMESSGATLSLNIPKWPMFFRYSKAENEQDSILSGDNVRTSDFYRQTEERLRYAVSHNFTKWSRMRFEFDRKDRTSERVASSTDTEEDRYKLLHYQKFGKEGQHRLTSSLHWTELSGGFDWEQMQWSERLELKHSDNLRTHYIFRRTESDSQNSTTDDTYWEGGFQHKLFESLTTTGQVFLKDNKFGSDASSEALGSSISFGYRKKNPFGVASAGYSIGYVDSEQEGNSETAVVIDELHVATLAPVELNQRNIIISTIRVKDGLGNDYQIGSDYNIIQIGDRVQLDLILFGGATPNFTTFDGSQQFFVDYEYGVGADKVEKIHKQFIQFRQHFKNGVTAFFEQQIQNESIRSTSGELPDNLRNTRYGLEYNVGKVSLLAELMKNASTQQESHGNRLKARYSWDLDQNTRSGLYAFREVLYYTDPDDFKRTLYTLGGDITQRFSERSQLHYRVSYYQEDDSRGGESTGFKVGASFDYKYRQFDLNAGVEHDFLDHDVSENESTICYARLKRYF